MKLLKNKFILIGLILWPLIIAIPQFNSNYSIGLLSGTLAYGEIPSQVYAGLFAGLFATLFFLGAGFLVSKIINKIFKKETSVTKIFFYITIFFFVVMVLTQGKTFYNLVTLEEGKVKEARELIIQQQSQNTSK